MLPPLSVALWLSILLLSCRLQAAEKETRVDNELLESANSTQEKFAQEKIHRIVGGHPVPIYKHPHQVSLRRRGCAQCSYEHLCGGSIYSDMVVITAAHCIFDKNVNNYMVVAGTDNFRGGDGAIVRVRKIIVHPNYDETINDNDAALVFLATALPLNDVTMAAIPLTSRSPEAGERAVVTGWGNTEAGGTPPAKLMAVEVPIVDHEECSDAYMPSPITKNMICAGFLGEGGKDSCQGDSGGPFVVDEQLAGIVSFGRSCALPDYPGVYANVFELADWILDTVLEEDK